MLFSIFEATNKFKGGSPTKEEMDLILQYVGKHQKPTFPIDKNELSAGKRTELEHTDDPQIAQNIAQDRIGLINIAIYFINKFCELLEFKIKSAAYF